jgi:membrane protease YdiL (CAAX protease family)
VAGRGRLLRLALLAEGGLVLVALVLGRWLGAPPFAALGFSWRGLAWGIGATAPLLFGLWWILGTRWPPVLRLMRAVEQQVAPLFSGASPLEIGLLAILAGVGEEAVFRGVIQTALTGPTGPAAAIVIGAACFGLAHALTAAYAVLAGMVGAYLGWAFYISGNLFVPIVAHALYDVAALAVLASLQAPPPNRSSGPE